MRTAYQCSARCDMNGNMLLMVRRFMLLRMLMLRLRPGLTHLDDHDASYPFLLFPPVPCIRLVTWSFTTTPVAILSLPRWLDLHPMCSPQ